MGCRGVTYKDVHFYWTFYFFAPLPNTKIQSRESSVEPALALQLEFLLDQLA
jgi:hypothetical protein